MRLFKFKPWRGSLTRFGRDETGSAAIEGVMGTLILFGWMLIAFQLYDAFRLRADATRSTYVIADMISRQSGNIGPKYVNGLKKVFDFLTNVNADNQTFVRVTLFKCKDDGNDNYCDGVNKKFTLVHSYVSPGKDGVVLAQGYTQAALNAEASRIPIMAAGDMAVLTETIYRYNPFIGLGNASLVTTAKAADGTDKETALYHKAGLATGLSFPSFVVTRPREARITWSSDS